MSVAVDNWTMDISVMVGFVSRAVYEIPVIILFPRKAFQVTGTGRAESMKGSEASVVE